MTDYGLDDQDGGSILDKDSVHIDFGPHPHSYCACETFSFHLFMQRFPKQGKQTPPGAVRFLSWDVITIDIWIENKKPHWITNIVEKKNYLVVIIEIHL
jgi:hypothetical protein